jgi:protein-S-isoprenylcysteine O-methyltransferase Ste14
MGRVLAFLYGLVCYVVFLGTFLYAIGFVANLWVPKSIDSQQESWLGKSLLIDVALLAVFAVQHSVMARGWFKRGWTRIVPKEVERSTFVLVSSLVLILLFWQWQPLIGVIWNVESEAGRYALWALQALGWVLVLVGTFLIDHFDLFGLRQVYLHLKGREYAPVGFRSPLLYQLVRHPIMLGFVVAFWATPRMTLGHLLFAIATTLYILIALRFEERDLVRYLGSTYEEYRQRVPMLLPLGRRKP